MVGFKYPEQLIFLSPKGSVVKHMRGQANMMGMLVSLILIIAVLIPTAATVITAQNFTGITKTVTDLIPVFLGIGAMILSVGWLGGSK